MPTTRIRGGTPMSDEPPQESIGDPHLLTRLDKLNRLFQTREAERIQAAVDAANALYPPPSTPEREESPPIGGLLSPASSPPRGSFQLYSVQPLPPAVSNSISVQPVTFGLEEPEAEPSIETLQTSSAQQSQPLRRGSRHRDTPILSSTTGPDLIHDKPLGHQTLPLAMSIPRSDDRRVSITEPSQLQLQSSSSRQQLIRQRSIITTRSRASPRAKSWELDKSGRRGRKTMLLQKPGERSNISAQVAAHSLNRRTASTKPPSSGGVKKQKAKRNRARRKG
ncbi:MAG: hypothetical protein L6R39_000053 [Caloplaca ligustica]|nr:MAG: hypothetical protein L6R39_000053 [Caloplaca ligustica]